MRPTATRWPPAVPALALEDYDHRIPRASADDSPEFLGTFAPEAMSESSVGMSDGESLGSFFPMQVG